MPADAGIEPRTVATGALADRRSNHFTILPFIVAAATVFYHGGEKQDMVYKQNRIKLLAYYSKNIKTLGGKNHNAASIVTEV